MRTRLAAAAAASLYVVLGGAVLAQDASPVPAQRAVLYEITVPVEAIPVGLEKVPVDQWTVASGVDAVIPLGNEAIRGRGCLVRSGTLTVTPATESLLWRAADAVGGSSTVAPVGEPLALEAGDVFLLPAVPDEQVDASAVVGLANPGPDDAVVFCFHLHQPGGQFSGWPAGFAGTPDVTHYERPDMQATEAGDAVFRLTRLEAPVGAIFERPDDAAYAFYIATQGGIKSSAGGPTWSNGMGTVLSALTEPPLQIVVVGDEPAEVLELAIIPSVETVATETEGEDAAAGGEASTSVELPAAVTGREFCQRISQGEKRYEVGGVDAGRAFVSSCNDIMSDPRVSGLFTNTFNWECDQSIERCVFWGTHVMDEPDRGWDCSWTGTDDPSGDNWGLVLAVCPGSGANDGLTYVFQHVFDGPEDIGNGTSFHGVIYEGPPPPLGPLPVE